MEYIYLFRLLFLYFLNIYPEVELLNHVVVLYLVFWTNLYTIFHSGYTNLHSHQQCKRVPFSPRPHQHSLFLVFLVRGILTDVGWHLFVVLICISLMISNVKCLSLGLLAMCLSFLGKCIFSSSAHFKIRLPGFWCWVIRAVYICWILAPARLLSLANIFSHSAGCLFILWMVSFAEQNLLSLIRSYLFIFAFISFALGDGSKKYCCDFCQRVPCLCFPLGDFSYLVLHLGL